MSLTEKENVGTENVIDITIAEIKKTRFRINGDPDSVIELNLSDLGIIDRLKKGIDKLEKEMKGIAGLSSDEENLTDKLNQADANMRDAVDYIFDYPVSAACAKNGTMYDPFNGMFRYEYIIDTLTKLYSDNINAEYKKFKERVQKHTDKYTTKGKSNK